MHKVCILCRLQTSSSVHINTSCDEEYGLPGGLAGVCKNRQDRTAAPARLHGCDLTGTAWARDRAPKLAIYWQPNGVWESSLPANYKKSSTFITGIIFVMMTRGRGSRGGGGGEGSRSQQAPDTVRYRMWQSTTTPLWGLQLSDCINNNI